jgi:hypothetical protein
MTFKDLKKIIGSSNQQQQQIQSFDKLQNKPFWIWNIEEHKLEDVRTKGECCFNHIIGLPTKEGLEKPIFDYQQLLYEALLSSDFCNHLNHSFKDKHLWIRLRLRRTSSSKLQGWTRGNKKALATILPAQYWNKLRALSNFDYHDIAATHKIMKRDVGIAYTIMRKIHYNVMRFRETMGIDEAEVLAGRYKSVSGRYYVLHDPEKFTDKYITAWKNFGIDINDISTL